MPARNSAPISRPYALREPISFSTIDISPCNWFLLFVREPRPRRPRLHLEGQVNALVLAWLPCWHNTSQGVDSHGDGDLASRMPICATCSPCSPRSPCSLAGTGPEHVAKLTIYLAAGVDPWLAYAATRSVWGDRRTAVNVLAVTPARPGALV